MEYVVLWIVFALAVGIWAGKRGRGSGTWFFVAIIISPILSALLLWSLEDKSAPRPTPKTHVKCPDCQELVLNEARKCKHCGCALIPQPAEETTWEKLTKMR